MTSPAELDELAAQVAALLNDRGRRLVLAESCTGGLASAVLARIPGISAFHCGSAVVYRLETKVEWLGVSRELLEDPGPVSAAVAEAMVRGVLARTPEAELAGSVTGHLGPGAPAGQDGLVFIGVARRGDDGGPPSVAVAEHRLEADPVEQAGASEPLRDRRQRAAAALLLGAVATTLRELAASA